jgi:hypothetical protein
MNLDLTYAETAALTKSFTISLRVTATRSRRVSAR